MYVVSYTQHVTLRQTHHDCVVHVGQGRRYANELACGITGWIQAVLSSIGRFPISHDADRTGENSKMMNPLSSERPSAGAVMAFDGQTENTFSRRNLCVSR